MLSILIATMPKRSWQFKLLMQFLNRQIQEGVEILSDDSMDYNIGVKRNKLLERASGKYVVFIDDDDKVSKDYIRLILNACEKNPDCIGISGYMTTDGLNRRVWHISKDFGRWYEEKKVYYRTPNHISPVKREIALKAGFPEVAFGEDAEYSRRVLPMLKTEVKVPGEMYYYDFSRRKK